ncbi:MAG: SPOR domain-containing protein, partial [Bacteroidia bacterium]|nr:SPOR domain-containing protein [Bacteroidia bacterium]
MNIDNHIHELLFQHDCVIVPGLGGFVANYQSAYFNPSLQIFYPPNKKVAFNADLKENDGLLAKHVSNKNDCSYDEANEHISEFVNAALETLKADKIVEINKVGVLRYNKDENIEFNPGNESNFLLSSFGMSPVQAPAIRRTSTEKTLIAQPEP